MSPSSLSLIWHIVRTDLRAARVMWLLWVVLQAIDLINGLRAPGELFDQPRPPEPAAMALGLALSLAKAGVLLLLVSRVIHADPPVGTDAFWLTRPIAPARLALAKLLTVSLLVIGPPLAATTLSLMAWSQVPPLYVARIALELGVLWLVPLLIAVLVAAMTDGLRRFALFLVGSFVLLTGFGQLMAYRAVQVQAHSQAQGRTTAAAAKPVADVPLVEPPIPTYPDPTILICGTLVVIAGFMVVIRQHYRWRDWRLAAAGTVMVFAATTGLVRFWPGLSFARVLFAADEAPDAEWARPPVTRLRLANDRLRLTVPDAAGRHTLAAPVVLDGLPDDYTATPFTLRSELIYTDGPTIWSGRAAPLQHTETVGAFHPSLTPAFQSAPLPAGPGGMEAWPTLAQIPANVVAGTVGHRARYTGTFYYRLAHHERLATLPLVAGTSHRDGPRRLAIRSVGQRARSQCRIVLEVSGPGLALAGPREPAIGYHFVDRRTGALVRTTLTGSRSGAGAPVHMLFVRENGPLYGSRFAQVDLLVRVESTGPAPAFNPPQACADTDLIVVRTTAAGALTRTLFISDLRLPAPTYGYAR